MLRVFLLLLMIILIYFGRILNGVLKLVKKYFYIVLQYSYLKVLSTSTPVENTSRCHHEYQTLLEVRRGEQVEGVPIAK